MNTPDDYYNKTCAPTIRDVDVINNDGCMIMTVSSVL